MSIIELDLYFIIIYLCMKYESNTPMFSKDIARKPFSYVRDGRTYVCTYVRTDKSDAICPPIINGGGIKSRDSATFSRKSWEKKEHNKKEGNRSEPRAHFKA